MSLHRTPLYDLHVELGAKMVGFAGYDMPVQYPLGVLKEHRHTRAQAGLFDVSHMGQLRIHGPGAEAALEKLLPIDLSTLALNQQSYSLLTNKVGGIIDDLIITRWGDEDFFLVVNAGCKEQDIKHLREHLDAIALDVLADQALLALQGPAARAVMLELCPTAAELTFMSGSKATIDGAECFITCSGYTGEDGFEISIPADKATALGKRLLDFDSVEAIGLGARDSLRLEAGLCLHGHDIDTNTSPVDASLNWAISKSRRIGGSKSGGFIGDNVILKQLEKGPLRKRVGFAIEGRAPLREGCHIFDSSETIIGTITSGGFSPTLEKPIAMGYINLPFAAIGSEVHTQLRGKRVPLTVTKMPFVPQRYHR